MLARSSSCALLTLVLLQHAVPAHAICRVVEPVEERGGVWFDPNTLALYVVAPEQVVAQACKALPATPMPDDAGVDDAGADDDAGRNDDAALAPASPATDADGPCAPGETLVSERGAVIHMAVQPAVLTGGGRAGLVMPVPARPDIHAAPHDLFLELGALLEPEVVMTTEYVEDASLGYQCNDPKFSGASSSGAGCMGDTDDGGGAFDWGDYAYAADGGAGLYDPGTEAGALDEVVIGDGVVRFEEALVTEDYDVTVLSATTLDALVGWLDENGFGHDAEDDAAFAAYLAEGAWFVALDVHPPVRATGRGLAPLVASWRGERVPVLHRLQYHVLGGEITTEAFVIGGARMDVADGSAETLYAGRVTFGAAAQAFGLARGWLTQLRLTRRLDEWREDSFLHARGGYEVRPVLERIARIRIPSSECPSGASGGSPPGCACRAPGAGWPGDLAPLALCAAWLVGRARRRRRA